MKNICYFQSGGPTAVINSSFEGLFRAYQKLDTDAVFYVSRYGIESLLNDELIAIDKECDFSLEANPGSYWGSARKKLPADPEDPLAKILVDILQRRNIGYVFVNGGNDSMDTCHKISIYAKHYSLDVKVVGIPKTIDNDLIGMDHTPGYGSAAKFVANAVLSVAIDDASYRKGRVNIIEAMGRDCGYLTAASLLASLRGYKPDYIYVPEVAFDIDKFLADVKKTYEEKGRCLVVVSEGIRDKDGNFISDEGTRDSFNNVQIGGVSHYLASRVSQAGMKTRGIELSVIQRAASFLQSKTDVNEAREVGKIALEKALAGKTGIMVGIQRVSSKPYQIEYVDIDLDVCGNGTADGMPKKYITPEGNNIDDSFLDYVLPLVSGNVDTMADDGLIHCLDRSW